MKTSRTRQLEVTTPNGVRWYFRSLEERTAFENWLLTLLVQSEEK